MFGDRRRRDADLAHFAAEIIKLKNALRPQEIERHYLPDEYTEEFLRMSDEYAAIPPGEDLLAKYKLWEYLRGKTGLPLEGEYQYKLVDSKRVAIIKYDIAQGENSYSGDTLMK